MNLPAPSAAPCRDLPPGGRSGPRRDLGLPRDSRGALSDDGTDLSASAALVRKACAAVAGCAIGSLPVEAGDDLEADEIATELNMLFEYLGLER
jgi:hypothetical protein